jgi:Fe2+ transport system protein FeoA
MLCCHGKRGVTGYGLNLGQGERNMNVPEGMDTRGNAAPTQRGPDCSLCSVPLHQQCVITRMSVKDPSRLGYLAALGLMPHSCLIVEAKAPFGGPLLLYVGGARYAVGRETAGAITVQQIGPAEQPAGDQETVT